MGLGRGDENSVCNGNGHDGDEPARMPTQMKSPFCITSNSFFLSKRYLCNYYARTVPIS